MSGSLQPHGLHFTKTKSKPWKDQTQLQVTYCPSEQKFNILEKNGTKSSSQQWNIHNVWHPIKRYETCIHIGEKSVNRNRPINNTDYGIADKEQLL